MGGIAWPRRRAVAMLSQRPRTPAEAGRKFRSNSPRRRATVPTIESTVIVWRPRSCSLRRPSAPTRTWTLDERGGYVTLTRLGLVSYQAFRAELVRLSAAGLVVSDTASDGSTMWRLTPTDESAADAPAERAP